MPGAEQITQDKLEFEAPFDWSHLLAFFHTRAVPGLEQVEGASYIRRFDGEGTAKRMSIHCLPDKPSLQIRGIPSKEQPRIYRRVRNLFDLDAKPQAIAATLGKTRALREALPNLTTIRVPGSWDLFEIGVRAILGQQVTVAGARTLTQRLVKQFGHPPLEMAPTEVGLSNFPKPEHLIDAPIVEIGMPGKRAEAIRRYARLMLESPSLNSDPSTFAEQLLSIPGIGPWTVNYIRMRGLKDPDAFPRGDIALLRAAQHLRIADTMKELLNLAEQWRPYRAYATIALWKVLSEQTQA